MVLESYFDTDSVHAFYCYSYSAVCHISRSGMGFVREIDSYLPVGHIFPFDMGFVPFDDNYLDRFVSL